jgi:hypothetical protein
MDYRQSIKDSLRSLAVEAAASPHAHEVGCRAFGGTPIDRGYVVNMWGERAALAWDDMVAARKSFYRATQNPPEAALRAKMEKNNE